MFGSFLPSLWSLNNHSLLGSRSRHCYAIMWICGLHLSEYGVYQALGENQILPRYTSLYNNCDKPIRATVFAGLAAYPDERKNRTIHAAENPKISSSLGHYRAVSFSRRNSNSGPFSLSQCPSRCRSGSCGGDRVSRTHLGRGRNN